MRDGQGNLNDSGRWETIDLQISIPVDANEFEMQPPPKTRVYDRSSGESVEYVIQEDKEKGIVIPSELLPSYIKLDQPPPQRRNIAIALLVICVIIAILVATWRVRRRQSRI